MAGLDLSGVRSMFESWILDTGRMTRDNGASDDTLNEQTGDLTPAALTVVYTGVGSVQALPGPGAVPDIDTQTTPLDKDTTARLLLPLASPKDIRVGDKWEVLTVDLQAGDPQLVGETYEVTQTPSLSSFSVVRFIYLKPA